MSFFFIDQETGESVELHDFGFVMENQDSAGFLEFKGRKLRRDFNGEFARMNQNRKGRVSGKERVGPLNRTSVALGVHPSQVDECREHYRSIHPGIEFRNNGDVNFTSRGARKAFLKSTGQYDRDGGYGD